MGFNGCKCKAMHFGINNPKYMYTFTITYGKNTTALGETVSKKDFGVHVDTLLTFKQHIYYLTTKKASWCAPKEFYFIKPQIFVDHYSSLLFDLSYGIIIPSGYHTKERTWTC